jgi:hypothetical protein
MVLAVAALCLPNPNSDFHFVDEIVSLDYSVRKQDSNFHSQDKPVSSPQPVNPSIQPGTVADLLHDNQIPQINQIQKPFLWGTVETEFGTVSSNDQITLYSLSQNKSYTTFSDINGQFQFDGILAAADYRLTVIPRGMFNPFVKEGVDVTSDQIAPPIVLLAFPAGTLHGVVVNSEGVAIPDFRIKAQSRVKIQWRADIVTDLIGQFQVENVPVGTLEFSSTSGQVVTITGHHFEGDLQTPLTLVVDEGLHEVNGRVYDQFNNPVSGAKVNLSWVKFEGEIRSMVNRHTTTNPFGYFSMKGVGSGEHDLTLATITGVTHRRTVNIPNDSTGLAIVLTQASPLY